MRSVIMGNVLPKDGRLSRQIMEPPGFFLWLGLILFVAGLFTDSFSFSNPKLRFGGASLALSLGWTQLSQARIRRSLAQLILGLIFVVCFGFLVAWPILPASWKALLARLV